MNRQFFAGKKVLIMGLGRFGGGVDVAKFVCSAGAEVIITDLASAEQLSDSLKHLQEFSDVEYRLGSHDTTDFEQTDVVIVNPAVTPDNEFLKLAREQNKFITSQISIFFELCPAPIIGITGANGKSTTAALTAHLLKNARYEIRVTSHEKVWFSGNIGNEPLLTVTDQIGSDDLVVLELSSFQIEQLAQIQKAPQVALLTNLTPNHLDRYGTFAAYCAAKENIFKFQELDDNRPAVSIFNAEDRIGCEWFDKYSKGRGRTCVKFSADDVTEKIRARFRPPGRANLSNLAAAITIARSFGIVDDVIKDCLPDFKPLPHRLELVAEIEGVRWYNDSKATTPQGAITALEAFDCPTIIIAGGYDKNLPFDELGSEIAQKAKAAILIGQTAQKIADAIPQRNTQYAMRNTDMSLRGAKRRSNLKKRDTRPVLSEIEGYEIRDTNVEIVSSLSEAVESAKRIAAPGDVVLLSPACASYDMFDNFEHRGREFIRLVQEISS